MSVTLVYLKISDMCFLLLFCVYKTKNKLKNLDFSVAIQFTIEFDDHTSEIVHIVIDHIDSKSSFVLVFGLESVQRKIRPGGLEKQSKRHEEQLIKLRTNREYQQNAKFDREFSKYTLYSGLVCVS